MDGPLLVIDVGYLLHLFTKLPWSENNEGTVLYVCSCCHKLYYFLCCDETTWER